MEKRHLAYLEGLGVLVKPSKDYDKVEADTKRLIGSGKYTAYGNDIGIYTLVAYGKQPVPDVEIVKV